MFSFWSILVDKVNIDDYSNFENLLKSGARPKLVYDTVKTMRGGRLSICQCDMLKLIDKYVMK